MCAYSVSGTPGNSADQTCPCANGRASYCLLSDPAVCSGGAVDVDTLIDCNPSMFPGALTRDRHLFGCQ